MYPASVISAGQGHKQDISGTWGKGTTVLVVCVCVCVPENCRNSAVYSRIHIYLSGQVGFVCSWVLPQFPSRLKSDIQSLKSLTSNSCWSAFPQITTLWLPSPPHFFVFLMASLGPWFPFLLFFFFCLRSSKLTFIHSFDKYLWSICYISNILAGPGNTFANTTDESLSLRAWWQCDEG